MTYGTTNCSVCLTDCAIVLMLGVSRSSVVFHSGGVFLLTECTGESGLFVHFQCLSMEIYPDIFQQTNPS